MWLDRTPGYLRAAVYADTSLVFDHQYRITDNLRELKEEALHVRTLALPQQLAFFEQVRGALFQDVDRWEPLARVSQAQALHLMSFTLASSVRPPLLLGDLRPAVTLLHELRTRAPAVARFTSLLERTSSMLESKSDDYEQAFRASCRAHAAIASAPDDSDQTRAEASQQVWLQECGQLIRLVETMMVHSDRSAMRAALVDGVPPERSHDRPTLAAMRVVAAYGRFAGQQACATVDSIVARRGELPGRPSQYGTDLAAATWYVTAPIMYARACLVKATVDLALDKESSGWREVVPAMFARCVDHGTALQKSHLLDLNRVALHYAFLTGGRHPMAGRAVSDLAGPNAVPEHLRRSPDGRLDLVACSRALAEAAANANILDNLGFVDFHQVLRRHGGTTGEVDTFTVWLAEHRRLQAKRVLQRWAAEDSEDAASTDIHGAVRVARRSTAGALTTVAGLVREAAQYPAAGFR